MAMGDVVPVSFEEIPKTEGRMLANFTLPYELVEAGGVYTVSVQGSHAEISLHNERITEHFKDVSRGHLMVRGSPRIVDDTKGFSVISRVTMEIQFVANPQYLPQIALEYLNRLLDVWRSVTGKFWLKESVSPRDILSMMWKTISVSGEEREGFFGFGLPGTVSFPYKIRDATEVLPIIQNYLKDETVIPLFEIFTLNALNHFIERRFGLTIIEINVALEEFVTRYLANKLLESGVTKEETSKRLSSYDSLHKKMDRGFRDTVGASLKDNPELWDGFNRMRSHRKNTLHPFVRKASYKDATDTIYTANRIAAWITQH